MLSEQYDCSRGGTTIVHLSCCRSVRAICHDAVAVLIQLSRRELRDGRRAAANTFTSAHLPPAATSSSQEGDQTSDDQTIRLYGGSGDVYCKTYERMNASRMNVCEESVNVPQKTTASTTYGSNSDSIPLHHSTVHITGEPVVHIPAMQMDHGSWKLEEGLEASQHCSPSNLEA